MSAIYQFRPPVVLCHVKEAVTDFKKSKSAGLDTFTSKLFKYSHDKVHVLLSIVLGYLPYMCMGTLLISIVKDKKVDINDGNNYTPIANNCIASKILELVILDTCLDILETSHNQFGFKK